MKYENLYDNIFIKARGSVHDLEAEVTYLLPHGMKQGHEWMPLNFIYKAIRLYCS